MKIHKAHIKLQGTYLKHIQELTEATLGKKQFALQFNEHDYLALMWNLNTVTPKLKFLLYSKQDKNVCPTL